MKLGTTTLPNATMSGFNQATKQVVHQIDWSDEVQITDMGLGPLSFTVTGTATTEQERLDVIAACNEARSEATMLFFPSTNGGDDDRYYSVKTSAANCDPYDKSAELWTYLFNCVTTPYPYLYDATTGSRLT